MLTYLLSIALKAACLILGISTPGGFPPPLEAQEEKRLLNDVYTAFGQYSAWALSDMTHETRPWKETKPNGIISKQLMKDYFMTQIENG